MTGGAERIRALVADDEPLVREGISAVLSTDDRIDVVAEVGDGDSALAELRSRSVDVAILDIQMPGRTGLEVLSTLRREGSQLPCLFVTTFGEDDYVATAIGLGADGFVLKSGDPQHLLMAVRAVAGGGAFFSPSIARRLLRGGASEEFARRTEAAERIGRLTEREQQILRLLADGMTNAEIAAELYLAPGTVKVHVSSILRTTGARNRVEAALLFHRNVGPTALS